jgi:hypothetical protein
MADLPSLDGADISRPAAETPINSDQSFVAAAGGSVAAVRPHPGHRARSHFSPRRDRLRAWWLVPKLLDNQKRRDCPNGDRAVYLFLRMRRGSRQKSRSSASRRTVISSRSMLMFALEGPRGNFS